MSGSAHAQRSVPMLRRSSTPSIHAVRLLLAANLYPHESSPFSIQGSVLDAMPQFNDPRTSEFF